MIFNGIYILHIHKIGAVGLDKTPIFHQKIIADRGKRFSTFDYLAGAQVIKHISAYDLDKSQIGDQDFLYTLIALYNNRILIFFCFYLLEYFIKGEEQFFF